MDYSFVIFLWKRWLISFHKEYFEKREKAELEITCEVADESF